MKNTNNSKDKEIWKDVVGFEGLYEVSNRGRVMSLIRGKVLKYWIDCHGYPFVVLYKANSKPKHITVHKLVAESFIDNPNNLPQVDHIDEVKTNNDVSNLRWVSASENIRHSIYKQSCRIKQITKDGELVKVWDSLNQIEKETGYSQGNIIRCCKGKYKQSHGYRWEYVDPDSQKVYNRPVAALTKDGELVAEYKSATEASRCLKIKYKCIYYCLNGTCKSTHGLKFIYID